MRCQHCNRRIPGDATGAERDEFRAEAEQLRLQRDGVNRDWARERARAQRLEAALREARNSLGRDHGTPQALVDLIDRALAEESKP